MHKVVLTIDVEDWFQVRNFQSSIPVAEWDSREQRVYHGLDFVLEELDRRKIRATFFVLGWIAARHPGTVIKIASKGHEIASHGYSHLALDELTPDTFGADLSRSLDVLERLTGKKILGFRAPSFSMTKQTWWALGVLRKKGISYDSSIYPVRHPNYGIPGFSQAVQSLEGIVEVPMTTTRVAGIEVPCSGGGYFRLYPYAVTRHLLRSVCRERSPVLYFHPWEFDPEQPRQNTISGLSRFRHYTGLRQNRSKFSRLLDDFEVCSVGELLKEKGFDLS